MGIRQPPTENNIFFKHMIAVYFDQCLGASHSKCWFKYAFSMSFFAKKLKKGRKNKKFEAKMEF